MGILDRLFRPRLTAPQSTRPNEEPPASPAPSPSKSESPLAVLQRSLDAVRESIQAEDARLSEVSKQDQETLAMVEAKREFVREHRLDHMLCWLLEQAWHYPAWSQRPDAAKYVVLPLTEIDGEDEAGRKVIRFTMEGARYELHFKKWPTFGPDEGEIHFADLALTDELRNPWLALRVKQSLNDEYGRWYPSSIEAFRPGEWAVSLASIYTTADLARARELMNSLSGLSKVDELRKAFGVP